jgi:hypothetical protein
MALGSTHARAPLGDAQQMRPAGHCASSQHAFAQTLPAPPVNARLGTHAPSSHCAETTQAESSGRGRTQDPVAASHTSGAMQLCGVHTPVTQVGGAASTSHASPASHSNPG